MKKLVTPSHIFVKWKKLKYIYIVTSSFYYAIFSSIFMFLYFGVLLKIKYIHRCSKNIVTNSVHLIFKIANLGQFWKFEPKNAIFFKTNKVGNTDSKQSPSFFPDKSFYASFCLEIGMHHAEFQEFKRLFLVLIRINQLNIFQ